MNCLITEPIRELLEEHGFELGWSEVGYTRVHRQDNRGGTFSGGHFLIKVEFFGPNSKGLRRHRVIEGTGDTLAQALRKVKAEITFIQEGRLPDGL